MSFDYGAAPAATAGGSFKHPTAGGHKAVLRSIIHIGQFVETYQGKAKPEAAKVVAIFELKNKDDFEDDGETPLEVAKTFSLRQGTKAYLHNFCKVFDAQNTEGNIATSFDDYIGRHCNIEMEPSDKLNEEGKPKYMNMKGLGSVHPELVETVTPLSVIGVGHMKYEDMTDAGLEELHPIRDVALDVVNSISYAGSPIEALVNARRAIDPTYAVKTAAAGTPPATPNTPPTPTPPPAGLDDNEEF